MNKYEQLIEFIINEEEDKARALFHEIVVEKSRDIYESLIDEQDLEEVGGNEVDSLVDEITADETGGVVEADEEEAEGDEFGTEDDAETSEFDFDATGDLDAHEQEHQSDEERIDDLEDALEELKAEFDKLMAQEAGEEEHSEEGFGEPEVEESVEADLVREYVEKVATPSNTEGADNKGSVVAGKNDMGGTAANIAKGGEESGMKAPKAKDIASGNVNVPGGKAALGKAPAAKKGEEGAVQATSPLAK